MIKHPEYGALLRIFVISVFRNTPTHERTLNNFMVSNRIETWARIFQCDPRYLRRLFTQVMLMTRGGEVQDISLPDLWRIMAGYSAEQCEQIWKQLWKEIKNGTPQN